VKAKGADPKGSALSPYFVGTLVVTLIIALIMYQGAFIRALHIAFGTPAYAVLIASTLGVLYFYARKELK
jgi:hypothetical protein